MNPEVQDGPQAFAAEWRKFHKNMPPLGWMLRANGTVPWVRYHALPGSKRYAENGAERATILSRANAVGDRLLGEGSSCWRVEARADDRAGAGDLAFEFQESDDPDELVWRFYVRHVVWHAGAFDTELIAIAEDSFRALWMCRTDGAVFAPYDGGFDLFPTSFHQVERLKAERVDWLSPNPEGL